MKKTLLSLAIFCFVATSMFAQKKVKGEGYIQYKMEMAGMSEEDPGAAALMSDVVIDMYMSGEDTRMNFMVMGGMITVGVIQKKGEEPVTLMEMMGQKMRYNGEDESMPVPPTNMTYVVNKKNTKKIAGYKCHEVKAIGEDGNEVVLYVTKKIKLNPPKGGMLGFIEFDKFDGYPLECFMGSDDGSFTFTAQEVSGNLEKDIFEYDKEAYKEMSDEELEGMGMDKGIIGL